MPPILDGNKRKRTSSIASDDGPPRKLNPLRGLDNPTGRTLTGKILPGKSNEGAITEIADAPADWNANELDLHEHDIGGQIERCHRRLQDNIMPQIFERRLQAYSIAKQRRDAMLTSEPSGLSLQVVQRLHDLKAIEQALMERDLWKQLPNVQSLMAAYRSKRLIWREGLVTYWSRGSQICKPKQFKWDEFERTNREYDGYKGFWVEGLHDPGPASLNAFMTIPPFNPNWFTHTLKIHVRVPTGEIDQEPRPVVLDFLDDTGSQFMHLYEDDLELLHYSAGRFAPGLGVVNGSSAAGWLQLPTVELEARICSDNDKPMTEWVKVQSTVQQGSVQSNGNHRLSGIWVRHVLFTATAPDNNGELMLSTAKSHLNNLPTVRPVKGSSIVTQTPARNFVPPASVGQIGTPQSAESGEPHAHSIFPGTPLELEPRPFSKRREYMTAVEVPSPSKSRRSARDIFPNASDLSLASSASSLGSPGSSKSSATLAELPRQLIASKGGRIGSPSSSTSSGSSGVSGSSSSSKSSKSSRSSVPSKPSSSSDTSSSRKSTSLRSLTRSSSGDEGEEDKMDLDEVESEGEVDVNDDCEIQSEEQNRDGDEEDENGSKETDESDESDESEDEEEDEDEIVGHKSEVEDSGSEDSESSQHSENTDRSDLSKEIGSSGDSDDSVDSEDNEQVELGRSEDSEASSESEAENQENTGSPEAPQESDDSADSEEDEDAMDIEDSDDSHSDDSDSDNTEDLDSESSGSEDSEDDVVKTDGVKRFGSSDSDSSDSEDSEDDAVKVEESDSSDSESSDSKMSDSEDTKDVRVKSDESDNFDSESSDSEDVDIKVEDTEDSDSSDSEISDPGDTKDDPVKVEESDHSDSESSDSEDEKADVTNARGTEGSEDSESEDSDSEDDKDDEAEDSESDEDLDESGSNGEDSDSEIE